MLKQGPKQKSLICLSFEAIEFPPVLFSPELAGQTLMLGMMSAKTTQQNSSFLQTQLSGEVVPYVSKEHSKLNLSTWCPTGQAMVSYVESGQLSEEPRVLRIGWLSAWYSMCWGLFPSGATGHIPP